MTMIQLLPARLKVALRTAHNDARALVRAATERRVHGVRTAASHQTVVERPRVPLAPSYQPPRVDVDTSRDAAPGGTVEFAQSGVTVELKPDETILEAGLRHGVDLLFSCTLGGCGACMLTVRAGEVVYDDREAICLSDDEIQDGNCLACVGRPRGHVVLEA